MARWLFNVMTMVWLRWRGGTTVRSRCCIDAIVWCSDGTIALMQGMSMMQWKWIDVLFHHHYRTIALLTNLHFCCLKKMAARLLCSLQLLWFTLHWSSMLVFNGCLFVWGLSSHSKIFHSFWDVTITGKGLKILTYARHSLPLCSEVSWRGTSTVTRDILYNVHLQGPVSLRLVAERLAVELYFTI